MRLGADDHGSKLDESERHAIFPDPLLHVEDGAARRQLDEQRKECEERRQRRQRQYSERDVAEPLSKSPIEHSVSSGFEEVPSGTPQPKRRRDAWPAGARRAPPTS